MEHLGDEPNSRITWKLTTFPFCVAEKKAVLANCIHMELQGLYIHI